MLRDKDYKKNNKTNTLIYIRMINNGWWMMLDCGILLSWFKKAIGLFLGYMHSSFLHSILMGRYYSFATGNGSMLGGYAQAVNRVVGSRW